MEERLQKYLSECGIASRRKCEQLIKDGQISVNDEIITDMGVKINTVRDVIKYKGSVVKKSTERIYILLNKPEGYVTTAKEQFGRPKVTDLVNNISERIYPVGRLDYNTSGLLILTNDGDVAFKLTHPGHEVEKTYVARIKGMPDDEKLDHMRNGIKIDGKITAPAIVNILKRNNLYSTIEITIHEGRNRQIRKMCSAIGHDVYELKRTAFGELTLGDLKKGQWRYLNREEIMYLKSIK